MDAGPVGLSLIGGDVNAERALSETVRGNKDGGEPNYTEKPKEGSAMRNISTAHEGNNGTTGEPVQRDCLLDAPKLKTETERRQKETSNSNIWESAYRWRCL